MTCLFCGMVEGTVPCHRVWEDERHIAFLTIFPNTPGYTVVIPKEHHPSDALALPDDVLTALVLASKIVAAKIVRAFDDVGRTALVFEGFGVDHVHAKLIPLHGTNMPEWRPILSEQPTVHNTYEGYLTTHDGPRAPDEELVRIAARIRNA